MSSQAYPTKPVARYLATVNANPYLIRKTQTTKTKARTFIVISTISAIAFLLGYGVVALLLQGV